MRINRVIIKKSGPLYNLDVLLSQVTLVIGDNERGKTSFINWISRGLFEKPGRTNTGEIWTDQLGGNESVQLLVNSFYPYYDSERMKNLLFIQETDLLFKYKNTDDLAKQEYWNNEINMILYGQDNISNVLQQKFFRALGVGDSYKDSWLVQFYDSLFTFKNSLEDLLPEMEIISNKEYGLFKLNNTLGSMDQIEQEFESEEDLYFMADKVNIGKKYLNLLTIKQQKEEDEQDYNNFIKNQQQIKQEINNYEKDLFSLEDKIDDLKLQTSLLQKKEMEIIDDPYRSYKGSLGETFFNVCIGIVMVITGLLLAFQTMGSVNFSLVKGFSLLFFLTGVLFLIGIVIKGFYIQQLSMSNGDTISFFHQHLIDKAKKEFLRKYSDLEILQKEHSMIQGEGAELKNQLKSQYAKGEILKTQVRSYHYQDQELVQIESNVEHLFGTIEEDHIRADIQYIESLIHNKNISFKFDDLKKVRIQKNNLLEDKVVFSNDFEKSKTRVFTRIKSFLEDIKTLPNQEAIEYFYPEIYSIDTKLINTAHLNEMVIHDIIEQLDFLIERVTKDRYRAERIIHIYHDLESQSESLLAKAMHTPFFEFLVQNIFNGKYKTFRAEFDEHHNIRIYAETGHGEFYPLENLSSATFAQFWLTLRLVLAKTILGNQPGVILLDDPFSTFDSIRKQSFIDLLNAFAHEGWQIICTITDDEGMYRNFQDTFGNVLTVVDLNKDYK